MKTGITLALISALSLTACATKDARQTGDPDSSAPLPQQTPQSGQAFAGVQLGKGAESGATVFGVVAGPAALAGLRRGDRIVEIDRIAVDTNTARGIINASAPGDRLALVVMRDNEPIAMSLEIGARSDWEAPGYFPADIPYGSITRLDPYEINGRTSRTGQLINDTLEAVPEIGPVDTSLERMFDALARNDLGFHKLPLMRSAFANPDSVQRWREYMVQTLHPFEFEADALPVIICETLAIRCPHTATLSGTDMSPAQFAQSLENANDRVRSVFAAAAAERDQAYTDMRYLLNTTALDRTLLGQPGVLQGVRAMQLSMRVDFGSLLHAATDLLATANNAPGASKPFQSPPTELQDVVRGRISGVVKLDDGYIVFGGPGDNHYDMDRLYAVVDIGGNDTYLWGESSARVTQTIVDLNGDDRYHADTGGPGAGWLGVSVLIDHAGSDTYESTLGGCGAGAMGFGFLIDKAGADIYRCAAWSTGTGVYGAGVLVDLGNEADVYESEVFSQGVGGPRGTGILVDAAGGDLYRANGPVTSAYNVPASFMAFSQGVGVGIRPYDTGGIGMLLDYGGDDRYEGGEFSQGGGYYWGLGLLADSAGNDFYYGDRYAQGFAAHQAFGMLFDLSGDDVYWAMAAAGQGAAWDQSIAFLIEAGGNDTYRAQTLSQGAAAQQSRAVLREVSGNDVYWTSGRDTQGAAGDNSYHYRPDDPVFSLGLLIDEQGDDRYSTGLENGETRFEDKTNAPKGRGMAGVARDLD